MNMPRMKTALKTIVLAILWIIFQPLSAGVEPELKNYLTGVANLTIGNSFVVYDQVFLQSNGTQQTGVNPNNWNLNKSFNVITLEINQETIIDCGYPQFSYSMDVSLEAKDKFGVMLTGYPKTVTLNVDYNNAVGAKYTERHSDTFSDAFYTKVSIVSVSNPALNDFVKIGSRTIIERYKDIDLNSPPIFNPFIVKANDTEIEFLWNTVDGAEEYDFEWAYVDDYNVSGGFTPLANLFVNFDNDATRVSIKENHYKISQVYEHGYIAVRIRAVGLNGANYSNRVNGDWTYPGAITPMTGFQLGRDLVKVEESSVSSADAYEHEPKLTWQYASDYSEWGKKKEIISYYDGSLRNRQTVTKVNTNKTAIVGENIYDHVGRMSISVLPVPTLENKLQYYHNFNVSSATNQNYSYHDFDIDNGQCNNLLTPMDTNSGASKYYSGNNTLSSNMHYEYLPHASGFPFAITEYEPDGTGRVRRQGGVGPNHQLGTGHETKYYYSKPDQQELDRLFGSAVGYAEHYQKEMVVDPNGQVSVSYKDLSGRVMATSLAGENAPNTSPLASMSGASTPVTFNLLSTSDTSQGTNFIQVNQKFTVAKQGNHTFAYSFNIPRYIDALKPNLCFDCVYDLKISLQDDCGTELMPGGQPITRVLGKPLGSTFDTDCEGGPLSYSFTGDAALGNQDITVNLGIGSYTIVKTLTINQQAVDFYEKEFLTGTGIKTEEEFIQKSFEKMDTVSCNMTCQECLDRIGTFNDFKTTEHLKITEAGGTPNAEDDAVIQDLFDNLQTNCDALCKASYNSCDAELEILKMDVSPGGQYANIDYNSTTNTTTYGGLLNPLYLYLDSSFGYFATKKIDGVSQQMIYTDANGKKDSIEIDGVMTPVSSLTTEQFVQYWKSSWADTLVTLHPEYCRYLACKESSASETFDAEMLATSTYSEALTKGYLNPLNSNSSFTYVAMDPFFASGGAGNSQLTPFKDLLDEYEFIDEGNTSCRKASAWELPLLAYICKQTTCTDRIACLNNGWIQTSCTPYLDRMWQMFRAIYLAEKGKIKEDINSDCEGDLNGRTSRYYSYDQAIELAGNDPSDAIEIRGNVTSQITTNCEDVCEAQADIWMQKLAGCSLSSADSIEMRSLLIDICERGCDANNPMGSSTVSSANTQTPGLNSFRDVFNKLKNENKLSFIPGICDINLIESPKKYDHDHTGGNKFSADKCDSFILKHVPSCVQNETDPEIRRAILDEITARQDSADCKDCINCKQLFNGVTALLMEYGSNFLDTSLNLHTVSQKFLNDYFGFNLTYTDYAQFARKCMLVDSSFDTSAWLNYYYHNFWSIQFPLAFQKFESIVPKGMGPIYDASQILYASLNAVPPPSGSPAMVPLDTCGCKELSLMHQTWESLPLPKDPFGDFVDNQLSCEQPPGTVNWQALLNHCQKSYSSMLPGNNSNLPIGHWSLDQTNELKRTVAELNLQMPDCMPCDTQNASLFIKKWIFDDCPVNCSDFLQHLNNFNSTCGNLYGTVKDIANGHKKLSDPSVDTSCLRQLIQGFHQQNPDQFPCPMFQPNDPRTGPYSPQELGDRDVQNFIDKYAHCLIDPYICDPTIWPTEDDSSCCYRRNGNDTVMYNFLNQMTTKVGGSVSNQFGFSNVSMYPLMDKFYNDNMYNGSSCSTNLVNKASWGPIYHPLSTSYNQYFYWGKINDGCGFNSQLIMSSTTATTLNVFPWIVSFDSVRGYANGCNPGNSFRARAHYLDPMTNIIDTTWICGYYDSMTYHETCQGPSFTLCNRKAFDIISERDTNPCITQLKLLASYEGIRAYKEYIDSLKYDFRFKYLKKCKEAWQNETFTRSFEHQEYHYTLYYYDQAGNLEQTVPPAGVDILSPALTTQVQVERENGSGTFIAPAHTLKTNYVYNSLNQLVWQKTPDAGESKFWYDNLGRLAVSQNAEQALNDHYSYTHFDFLGRVVEVGQLTSTTAMTNALAFSSAGLSSWHSSANSSKEQITSTEYDNVSSAIAYLNFTQENLRKRVVRTHYKESISGPIKYATYYTYDVSGNVSDIVREHSELAYLGHQYKLTHYEFDLISGNVNQVVYQPEQEDQFVHQYAYDGDNRIITVETSADRIHWDEEAHYSYYLHGPLKRTELGNQKVQGMDFVYNLQGWIKGVNGTTQESFRDVGKDGAAGSLNENVAVDAFGYSLTYFQGDHSAIGKYGSSPTLNQSNYSLPAEKGSLLDARNQDLWNGNIKTMVTAIKNLSYAPTGVTAYVPMARSFKYDQLNRLKESISFDNYDVNTNSWSNAGVALQKYEEEFSYDANGNIETLERWGEVNQMDQFTYNYIPGTNQLDHVNDAIGSTVYSSDIDNQNTGNYTYDAIGNLNKDDAEEIQKIKWTVYGKIKEIVRTPSSQKKSLEFEYTPDGHRALKKVYDPQTNITKYLIYSRDAQGNEMASYTLETVGNKIGQAISSGAANAFIWEESPIYGSSRVGMHKTEKELTTSLKTTNPTPNIFERGKRSYELSNHLGNVLVVISDKRSAVCSGTQQVAYYEPEILSANDYYSFGSVMEGRTYSSGTLHKYGFNGIEKDDETHGEGNAYDFGARIYDSRLGRWMSVDPLIIKYPNYSPYNQSLNNPIMFIDNGGKDVHLHIGKEPVGKTKIRLIGSENVKGAPATVEVNLYKLTVTDDVTGKTSTYYVTRDAPVINSDDPIDEDPISSNEYNVNNTAFEPKAEVGEYNLVATEAGGLGAYALRNKDGTSNLEAEDTPERTGDATGVMIHVGGTYTNPKKNTVSTTGSLGCFTLAGKSAGNDGINALVNDINKRKEANKKAGKGTNVGLKIEKRDNVDWTWYTDENGGYETWDGL